MNITENKKDIEKFMIWLKDKKLAAESSACGSGSSWNHAYNNAVRQIYRKAKKLLVEKAK